MPTIPSLSHDDARKELEEIVCPYGDYEPGEINDEVVDQWRAAYSANDQRYLLIDLACPTTGWLKTPISSRSSRVVAERSTRDTSRGMKRWPRSSVCLRAH